MHEQEQYRRPDLPTPSRTQGVVACAYGSSIPVGRIVPRSVPGIGAIAVYIRALLVPHSESFRT